MFSPAFIDLQVNGYAGVDFSSLALTPDQVESASAALARRGTLAFCPTVVTASPATYRHVLPLLAQAARGNPRLLGIHLEGPFISPEDGALGAHPRAHVRAPDAALFEDLYALADGRLAIITLAPERPGALEVIRRAVALGVVVSIGHTLADAAAVRAAVDAGARLSTHLGNGCPNLLQRHENPIWPQLAAPELTAMLITDGHHLPPAVIASFVAAKGAARVIVTSDSSPAAGLPPGDYEFFGARARLEPSGRLRNLERDTLAGSSATMLDCVNHLASLGLLDEAGLRRVAFDNPLSILGRDPASLPLET
jgi:N-acetylglucosamine-6-phosphate deacetylase